MLYPLSYGRMLMYIIDVAAEATCQAYQRSGGGVSGDGGI